MTNLSTLFRNSLIFIFLLSLGACSTVPNPIGKDKIQKRYEINQVANLSQKLNDNGPSLMVYKMQSSNLYNTTRIAYSTSEFEISYYGVNEWADTPANLLSSLIVANMENTGLFSAVVSSNSPAITNLALDTELLSLTHNLVNNKSELTMSVRMHLVDLRKRTIISSDTFTTTENTPGNDPYSAVAATNSAAQKLLAFMQAFVKHSIKLN